MILPSKKRSLELPFTQLWYNFSKQCQKQNKAIIKVNRVSQVKNFNQQEFRSMYEEIDKKRLSLKQTKRRSQSVLSHISVDNLSNISKIRENQEVAENKLEKKQQRSIIQTTSVMIDNKKQKSSITQQAPSQKVIQKISDKILQIIETNVIPFMVEKFIDLEERTMNQTKAIEEVMQKQSKQIIKLQKQNINLQQAVIEIKNRLAYSQSKGKRQDKKVPEAKINKQNKIDENIENSMKQSNKNLENLQKNDNKFRVMNNMLGEMAVSLQQVKNTIQSKITIFQKQIREMSEKNKVIEAEFAQKVLDMISTYNDNFVDMDQRISQIQQDIYKEEASPNNIYNDFKGKN